MARSASAPWPISRRFGRADSARLAGRERREVVVVHVVLAVVDADRVDHLLHARHAERRDAQHLGLTPLEQAGAVGRRQDPDFRGDRPQLRRGAPVDARAFADDPAPHDRLLERAERLLHLTGASGKGAGGVVGADERREQTRLDLVELRVALRLVGDDHRFGRVAAYRGAHGLEGVGLVVDPGLVLDRGDRAPLGLELLHELELEVDGGVDPLLRGFEAFRDDVFGDLRRTAFVELPRGFGAAGLDHHDRDVAVVEAATGDDHLEGRRVTFFVRGVGDPLAVDLGDAHGADRTVERDAGDHQRRGGAVDRRDVVGVLQVGAENRRDDLHLVAEPFGERRAQRPVGEATREDRRFAGSTFAPEERAGDLAGGVHPLFDVDREREEIDPLSGLAGDDRGQQRGLAQLHEHGAVGELGELAGFERQLLAARGDRAGHTDGTGLISGGHENALLSFVARRRFPVGRVRTPPSARGRARALATDNRRARRCSTSRCSRNGERTVRSPCVLLPAKTQLGDQGSIPLDVVAPEVVEQPTPPSDQHEQTTARVMVFHVRLQVLREVVDPTCEERDLNLCRSRVGLVEAVLADRCGGVGHASRKALRSRGARPAGRTDHQATRWTPRPPRARGDSSVLGSRSCHLRRLDHELGSSTRDAGG